MVMKIDALMLGTHQQPLKVRMDGMGYLLADAHDLIRSGFVPVHIMSPLQGEVPAEAALDPQGRKTIVGRIDGLHAVDISQLRLPHPPMKVFAFGDSIQWGQGLFPSEKIYQLVAAELSIANGGAQVVVGNFAGSGAIIGNAPGGAVPRPFGVGGEDPSGEVPNTRRTVRNQILNAPPVTFASDPTVDVVLVSGGINDVGVRTILRYVDNRPSIRAGTAGLGPLMARVLQLLVTRYPNAIIVVTGYYVVVSRRSRPDNPSRLSAAVARMGGGVATTNPPSALQKKWITLNCEVFRNDSNSIFSAVVATANAGLPNPRIFFASPNFGDDDALFAPSSQLWGIAWNDAAQDPLRNSRRASCRVPYASSPAGYLLCKLASIGHPTPGGAARYARQVMNFF